MWKVRRLLELRVLFIVLILIVGWEIKRCAATPDAVVIGNRGCIDPASSEALKPAPYKRLDIGVDSVLFQYWSDEVPAYKRGVPDEMMTPKLLELKARYGNCFVDYFPVSSTVSTAVLQMLPQQLLQLEIPVIEWQIIHAENLLIPHVDENRMSAINIYVETHKENTVFFTNATDSYRIPGINNTIFDPAWVSKYDEFTAFDGDVYILNVNEIHSVQEMDLLYKRVTVSAGFRTPYAIVSKYLEGNECRTAQAFDP
jgi:hypothetical protein